MRSAQSVRAFFYLGLLAGILFQGRIILEIACQDISQVRGTLGQTARWRSANFYHSQRLADFIRFLDQTIPLEVRVVLPPVDEGPQILSITPAMQFFLSPRTVFNCTSKDCFTSISPTNTVFMVTDASQVESFAPNSGRIVKYNANLGIEVPPSVSLGNASYFPGFERFYELLRRALWPVLWLLLLLAAGAYITHCLLPGNVLGQQAALGYGLALGWLSLGSVLVSFTGQDLSANIFLSLSAGLIGVGLVVFLLSVRRNLTDFLAHLITVAGKFRFDPWPIVFILMGCMAALIAVGKAYHSTDAILLWGAKGYGIATTGSLLQVTEWGTNTVAYPLHIPLLIAAFQNIFGDVLPASKMIFSGYYLAFLLVLYYVLLWIGIRRHFAGMATLLFATMPLVFRHATIGYANLPMTYYLVAAVFMMGVFLEASSLGNASNCAIVSGCLFALAAWTRPEGLHLAWLLVVSGLGLAYMGKIKPPWRQVVYLITPLACYSVFWGILYFQIYYQRISTASLIADARMQLMAGQLHFGDAVFVIRAMITRLFSFNVWNVSGMALVLFLLVGILAGRRPSFSANLFLYSGLLVHAVIFGGYYLTSYDTVHDIQWWVNTGLDRMMLPGQALLWCGAIGRLQLFHNCEKRAGSTNNK